MYVQVANAKQSLPAGSEEAVSGEELRKLILELFAEAGGGAGGSGGTAGGGAGSQGSASAAH